jgi:hypothetical protein
MTLNRILEGRLTGQRQRSAISCAGFLHSLGVMPPGPLACCFDSREEEWRAGKETWGSRAPVRRPRRSTSVVKTFYLLAPRDPAPRESVL